MGVIKDSYIIKVLIGIIFIILYCNNILAQSKKKIEIKQANTLKYSKNIGENSRRLIGDVIFFHDSVYMYCDSAWFYSESNSFKAFGNVKISQSDSLTISGQKLHYNGNTKTAELFTNVVLTHANYVLKTNHLIYNRLIQTGHYTNGGTILNNDTKLTSKKGWYYSKNEQMNFSDSVVLYNPDYTIACDSMLYFAKQEISYYKGNTCMIMDSNFVYCKNGMHNAQNKTVYFTDSVKIISKEQILFADSVFYNQNTGENFAHKNIQIIDTTQNTILMGNYAYSLDSTEYMMLTDSAVAIFVDDTDSLYMHGDTLKSILQTDSTDSTYRDLCVYYNVRFFRTDLQGKCDSLIYSTQDSVIKMFNKPILWTDSTQMNAEQINIYKNENQISHIILNQEAFISTEHDSVRYDQIKGKEIIAYFDEGELAQMLVSGNALSIYYMLDDNKKYTGINKTESQKMRLKFENSEIKNITILAAPTAKMLPPETQSNEIVYLKGFLYNIKERPISKNDIF